jgi:hypothetical protein
MDLWRERNSWQPNSLVEKVGKLHPISPSSQLWHIWGTYSFSSNCCVADECMASSLGLVFRYHLQDVLENTYDHHRQTFWLIFLWNHLFMRHHAYGILDIKVTVLQLSCMRMMIRLTIVLLFKFIWSLLITMKCMQHVLYMSYYLMWGINYTSSPCPL